MARVGGVREHDGERLTDRISVGVLAKVFPPDVVDAAIKATGKKEQRVRSLPARVVVYFVIAMCIWSEESYVEVMTLLTQGLVSMKRWSKAWEIPTDAAITIARSRLGSRPLAELFSAVAKPLSKKKDSACWYRNWHLMAIDGTVFDLPDTPANETVFGRPGSSRGRSAFPQARVVALAECGTHAIVDAVIGGTKDSEVALAGGLFRSLTSKDLHLADRGFYSFDLWKTAASSGAQLLWRMKSSAVLPALEVFEDGSYRSEVFAATDTKKTTPITVRVIEYVLEGRSDCSSQRPYRLITTIIDPGAAPATELAALYAQRWEIETSFSELKTTLRGAARVLRSKSADGVRQEIWSYLLVHYAIRVLIYESAGGQDLDPDRGSFIETLRIVRRHITGQAGFSPSKARKTNKARGS